MSIVVSLLSFIFAFRIEKFRSKLAAVVRQSEEEREARKGVRDARRAYEFDARKRLYQDLEPLLYQGSEAAQSIFNRIANIARSASRGHLGDQEASWLAAGNSGYYRVSLLHRFTSFWALHQIASRRFTHVDQSLDAAVGRRMSVQAVLFEILSDDFHLAEAEPPILYNPHVEDVPQGLARGYIDSAASFLISSDESDSARILDLGEFTEKIETENGIRSEAVENLSTIFDNFHPATHPVLWRCLVACAALSWTLIKLTQDHERDPRDLVDEFFADPRIEEKFDWRGDERIDDMALESPKAALSAARHHILERIKWQSDPILAGLERP